MPHKAKNIETINENICDRIYNDDDDGNKEWKRISREIYKLYISLVDSLVHHLVKEMEMKTERANGNMLAKRN